VPVSAFFARELAPTPRRFAEAARNATKATLTTGLSAIMQIAGPFGPLFAFRIGQPSVSFGLFEGAVTIIFAAAIQAAIVPIAGKILDYPGLILAFLFSVFGTIAYLLSNTKLFLPLALAAIGTITTLYVGIFEPGAIGWSATYTFDGILVATLVMVVIDTWIWPSPPEPHLLESIATDLESTRTRLRAVGRHLLDPRAEPLSSPVISARLAPKLAMLKSVEEHTKPTHHHMAALLDAVVTSERLFLEVERLAVLSDEVVSEAAMKAHGEQIATALNVLDISLTERTTEILAGLPDSGVPPYGTNDLRTTIHNLNDLPRDYSGASAEAANFLAAVSSLEEIARLLEPREVPAHKGDDTTSYANGHPEAHPFVDASRLRFSIKLGATIVLGLLVGLITQRADLQTILWSIVVAGQPNQYGAVLRKTILRIAGCIVGGLAALGAMRFISENFDSLPPYLVAIFAVTMFSTYVSQSSEWLGYAGIQTSITFLICYVGLGPSSDVYRPLWRFWGIVLGILTNGFVFLFLFPEYASDKLIQSLATLLRNTSAFARTVADGGVDESRIAAVERLLSVNLLEALNMADQAKLEGKAGRANSTNGIEAAATLIRIAYQFEIIARERLSGSERGLPREIVDRRYQLETRYCASLEAQLQRLTSSSRLNESRGTSTAKAIAFRSERTESRPDGAHEPVTDVNENLALEPETYRRLRILLASLDAALSKITSS